MATNEDKSKAFRRTITKREYARLRAMQTSNQFVVIKPFRWIVPCLVHRLRPVLLDDLE